MTKPDFLADVDGVVLDLLETWVALYNREYGDDLRPEQVTHWDMGYAVKHEARSAIYGYLDRIGLYDLVQPIDGALEGVRALRDIGFRVTYVTHCTSATMLAGKVDCLRRHGFLDLIANSDDHPTHRMPDDLIVAHRKDLLRGAFLLDDGPHNLEGFMGCGLLFDQPYNRASRWLRAHDWPDVVRIATAALPKLMMGTPT